MSGLLSPVISYGHTALALSYDLNWYQISESEDGQLNEYQAIVRVSWKLCMYSFIVLMKSRFTVLCMIVLYILCVICWIIQVKDGNPMYNYNVHVNPIEAI